jgi:hypothetical protein
MSDNSATNSLTKTELLTQNYNVDVNESISQNWKTFKRNTKILIETNIVTYTLLIVSNFIPFLDPLVQ